MFLGNIHKEPKRGCLRVSVQGIKSLGGHFECLCQGLDFYEVKKNHERIK